MYTASGAYEIYYTPRYVAIASDIRALRVRWSQHTAWLRMQAEAARAEAQSMAESREAAMAEMLEANASLRAELQAALMRQVRGFCLCLLSSFNLFLRICRPCWDVLHHCQCTLSIPVQNADGGSQHGSINGCYAHVRQAESAPTCACLEVHDMELSNGCIAHSYPL